MTSQAPIAELARLTERIRRIEQVLVALRERRDAPEERRADRPGLDEAICEFVELQRVDERRARLVGPHLLSLPRIRPATSQAVSGSQPAVS